MLLNHSKRTLTVLDQLIEIKREMELTKDKIAAFFLKNGDQIKKEFKINEVYLFGSFANGTASETSDIDIMYELQEGKQQSFREYMSFLYLLQDQFGRTVDLVRKSNFNPIIYLSAKSSMQKII